LGQNGVALGRFQRLLGPKTDARTRHVAHHPWSSTSSAIFVVKILLASRPDTEGRGTVADNAPSVMTDRSGPSTVVLAPRGRKEP
jgi:hypothetical protein